MLHFITTYPKLALGIELLRYIPPHQPAEDEAEETAPVEAYKRLETRVKDLCTKHSSSDATVSVHIPAWFTGHAILCDGDPEKAFDFERESLGPGTVYRGYTLSYWNELQKRDDPPATRGRNVTMTGQGIR